MLYLSILLSFVIMVFLRLYLILPHNTPRSRLSRGGSDLSCSIAVFLGSGGHTSEALILLSALDFKRYTPRKYIISNGDTLSAKKAMSLEMSKRPSAESASNDKTDFTLLTIPRARAVHQSILTTPPAALLSLLMCVYYVTLEPLFSSGWSRTPFADILLLNGPGTCVVLCGAVYFNKFLGLPAPRLMYVESFARVNSLSLSGKIMRPLVDRFIVQWPQLLQDHGRGDYRGWLV